MKGGLTRLSHLPLACLLALALGLVFQGTRGIWEPDEGYYANVAVNMLRSGDWFIPRLHDVIFLDKPPLQYWGMATGMALLGVNEWGARLANALWFAATVLVLELLGRKLWDRRTGRLAALLYTTSPLPFAAANVLTPDTPLAFWAVVCAYCYVSASGFVTGSRRSGWWFAFGLSAGLGVLTKGPAILIFIAPLVAEHLLRERKRAVSEMWPYGAALVAAAIGGLWYAPTIASIRGASAYLLDSQVIGRLITPAYHRNSGVLDGGVVYLRALVVGSLPWSALWPWIAKRWRRRPEGGALLNQVPGASRRLLLALWFCLPLAVLLVARSRMNLYALPLFAPLALATARAFVSAGLSVRQRRTLLAFMAVWSIGLVVIKASADRFAPPDRNTRAMADKLRTLLPNQDMEVIAVDRKMNGLPVYGFQHTEWITMDGNEYPFFTPVETLEEEMAEIREERGRVAFIVPEGRLGKFVEMTAGSEAICNRIGDLPGSVVVLCE